MRLAMRAFVFLVCFAGSGFAGDEIKCPKGQVLDPCGASSCPQCDDCVPACVSEMGAKKKPEGGYASCEDCAAACAREKTAKAKATKAKTEKRR